MILNLKETKATHQEIMDSIRDGISWLIEMPVILEFSIIPETIMRSTDVSNPLNKRLI